jgi:hypothetical protein
LNGSGWTWPPRITLYRTKSGKPRGIPINTAVYDALIALEPDLSPTHLRGAVARLDGLTPVLATSHKAHKRAHDAILEGSPQGSRRNPDTGGVAERLKAPVLKTGIPKGIGGSNPSPSAMMSRARWMALS